MLIILVLATQFGAPIPTNKSSWVRPDDMPLELMSEDTVYNVPIRLTIAPDGKLQSCAGEMLSQSTKLTDHTCKLLRQRARFRPAINSAGLPSYGVYRTSMRWWFGTFAPREWPTFSDLELTVSTLPPKIKSPATVRLIFNVDEVGRSSSCTTESSESEPVLVGLGCRELVKSYKAIPARSLQGKPVPSVQTGTVTFKKS
jgi:hypothetical protein